MVDHLVDLVKDKADEMAVLRAQDALDVVVGES
jgi:hypothetical protein